MKRSPDERSCRKSPVLKTETPKKIHRRGARLPTHVQGCGGWGEKRGEEAKTQEALFCRVLLIISPREFGLGLLQTCKQVLDQKEEVYAGDH